MDFTPILLRAPQVIITRESSETVFIDGFSGLSGKVLAVVKGFKTDELIQNQYPSIKPLYVKNVMEALRAVSDGRADAAADSLLVVNESVRREGLTNLRVSGTTHHYDEYRIGIRSDDPILASIIRKAVRSLSTEELNAVYNKWISIRYTTEVDYGLILRIALAGVLLLLVIVYWNHRLRGEVRMRKEMARRIGIVEKRTRLLYELDRQTPKLSERQVCERAVDIAVELSDSQVGYLHLIDADQQHLTLTAWNGEARKYCTASYDTHYPVCEAGVWADSLREMRTVIHNDYPKLESARGIPEGHFPVTRYMSTPAIDGDLGRLIIGVGNKEVPYEKNDAEHLEFIAGEILKIVLRQRAEQALKLARIEAEKANRAKSMFLANMSHELRTPLNAVLGFSQLLADDPSLGAGQRTHVDVINRSGQHLLQLINDVLDMSKIESDKMSLEIVDMDLSALVRETVDLMRGRAGDKGLSLHLDQAPGFPQVIRGDGPKIRQILINLLGNAIKFTRNGSVSLHLDAEQETFDRITLLGEVRDTGQGIDAADLERIFQPFEQLLAAVEQKGTGLGLAITRQFVELMNGEISVESTPGQGSTFRFTLLVEQGRRERVEAGAREISRQVVGIADPSRSWRVLTVEDNRENRQLLRLQLESAGFEVREAADGVRAVELFQEWRPDFIWMDRRMPRMDGLEAVRRIRALPGGGGVKIAALTASVFEEQREEVLAAGFDDYVRKPYRSGEVFDCMARHLGLSYRYRRLRQVPSEPSRETALPGAEELAVLPELWLVAQGESLEMADGGEALRLIDALVLEHVEYADLAERLHRAVAGYLFEPLVDLIGAARALRR